MTGLGPGEIADDGRLDDDLLEAGRRGADAGQPLVKPYPGAAQGGMISRVVPVPRLPYGAAALVEHVQPAGIIFLGEHRIGQVVAAGLHQGMKEIERADDARADVPMPLGDALHELFLDERSGGSAAMPRASGRAWAVWESAAYNPVAGWRNSLVEAAAYRLGQGGVLGVVVFFVEDRRDPAENVGRVEVTCRGGESDGRPPRAPPALSSSQSPRPQPIMPLRVVEPR